MQQPELAPNIVEIPQETILSPFDLYCLLYPLIQSDRLIYTSGPINSGGARALPGLPLSEVATRNCSFYLELAQGLALSHPEHQILVPHTIGRRFLAPERSSEPIPWGEVEYMTFWLMVIARVAPEAAGQFFLSAIPQMKQMPEMNNTALKPHERQPAYSALLDLTLEFIEQLDQQFSPVSEVASFTDSRSSMGSRLEQTFAQEIKVPVVEVSVADGYLTDVALFSLLVESGALMVHESGQGKVVKVMQRR